MGQWGRVGLASQAGQLLVLLGCCPDVSHFPATHRGVGWVQLRCTPACPVRVTGKTRTPRRSQQGRHQLVTSSEPAVSAWAALAGTSWCLPPGASPTACLCAWQQASGRRQAGALCCSIRLLVPALLQSQHSLVEALNADACLGQRLHPASAHAAGRHQGCLLRPQGGQPYQVGLPLSPCSSRVPACLSRLSSQPLQVSASP